MLSPENRKSRVEAAEGENKDIFIHNKSIPDQLPLVFQINKQSMFGLDMIRVVYGARSLLVLTRLLQASTSHSGLTLNVVVHWNKYYSATNP